VIALIDADVLCYQVGFSVEGKDVEEGFKRLDDRLLEILCYVDASDRKLFLSCPREQNFRTSIYNEYKVGRPPAPTHHKALRKYLIDSWEAEERHGLEADDLLGIHQTLNGDNSIICSIDKDLYQIPGNHCEIGGHYNNWQMDKHHVYPDEADWFFCYQWLRGDFVDKITGIPKVGDKKAKKYLEGCATRKQLVERTMFAYKEAKLDEQYMLLQANLVYILRGFYEFFSLDEYLKG